MTIINYISSYYNLPTGLENMICMFALVMMIKKYIKKVSLAFYVSEMLFIFKVVLICLAYLQSINLAIFYLFMCFLSFWKFTMPRSIGQSKFIQITNEIQFDHLI